VAQLYFLDETDGFDWVNQHDTYGFEEVPASAYFNKALVKFDDPILIEKPGYIYVYLSYENESNNYVYFDDLKVNYQKSQIVQSNNYYAFGLQTSDSWTRIDTKPNQYLYNAGSELNDLTSNYEMFFRGYDPAIGRMSGVDVMADSYSSLTPYNYSFNDPVYWNDPNGDCPDCQYQRSDDTWWAAPRDTQGKYQYYGTFANWAYQNWNTHGGGFNTYQNYYGSGWNNQMNNGSSFSNYGVATGWSDAYANAVINQVQDAKNGDAGALQAYGSRHGENFTGHVDFIGSESFWTAHMLNGNLVGSTSYAMSNYGVYINHYSANGTSSQNGQMTNFTNSSLVLTIGSGVYGAMEGATASQGYWLGKNGKYYSEQWGGNQYTGSRAGAFKAANVYKLAGRATVFVSAGIGVYSTVEGYQQDGGRFGYNTQMAAASTAGGIVGGIAGAKGGAAVGAAIGVWFGGIGAVPGAIIGGVIGGIGGSLFGSYAGESAVDYYHGR
jgi:RHS repeat-associated protein